MLFLHWAPIDSESANTIFNTRSIHQWHNIHVLILQLFNRQSCYTNYLLCANSRAIFNIICVNYNRNAICAVGLFVEFARGEKNILIIIITSSWQERFLPPRRRIELVNVINMSWWCGKTIQPSHMYTHVQYIVYSIYGPRGSRV